MGVTDTDFAALCAFMRELAPVPQALFDDLRRELGTLQLAKGEFFVRAGEPTDMLGFVLQGIVKVYYSKPDGTEHIRNIQMEGAPVAAYTALIAATLSDVSIRALEPSRLLTLSYATYVSLFDRDPMWQMFGRKIAEYYMLFRERREYQLLMYTAAERYEMLVQESPQLLQRLPQYEIAAYLGVTPVTLSRIVRARRPRRPPDKG